MRALVTGGAGFIGSNLVDALLERGDEVFVIDNLSKGREENLESAIGLGAKLTVADIRNLEDVAGIASRIKPSVIYHLAAQTDVRESVADPALSARINIEGTVNMLEAARKAGVVRFVNISTGGAIYGEAKTIPTPETAEMLPAAPYGQSKLAAEGFCRIYAELHNLSTISLRFGNVYGPRQDPLGEAGVIAIFCGKARDGKRPTIYGDGKQTRDYVYVGDIVDACIAAGSSDITGPINIGTCQETSVLELVEILAELAGKDFKPEFAPERRGEVLNSTLDPSKANDELGWQAKVDVTEGIKLTLASIFNRKGP